jgi:hypothetical protein
MKLVDNLNDFIKQVIQLDGSFQDNYAFEKGDRH